MHSLRAFGSQTPLRQASDKIWSAAFPSPEQLSKTSRWWHCERRPHRPWPGSKRKLPFWRQVPQSSFLPLNDAGLEIQSLLALGPGDIGYIGHGHIPCLRLSFCLLVLAQQRMVEPWWSLSFHWLASVPFDFGFGFPSVHHAWPPSIHLLGNGMWFLNSIRGVTCRNRGYGSTMWWQWTNGPTPSTADKVLLRWRVDPVARFSSLWDWGHLTSETSGRSAEFVLQQRIHMGMWWGRMRKIPWLNHHQLIIHQNDSCHQEPMVLPSILIHDQHPQQPLRTSAAYQQATQQRSFFKSMLCVAAAVCGISGIIFRGFSTFSRNGAIFSYAGKAYDTGLHTQQRLKWQHNWFVLFECP